MKLVKDEGLTKENLDWYFNEYYSRIYNYVFYRTMDRTLAEDVTSDVMYRVARSYASFDPNKGTLDSWTFRIARNLLFSAYRSRKNDVDIDNVAEGAFAEDFDEGDPLDERAELVKAILSNLDEDEREMIYLKFWEQLPNKVIAQRLNMNPSTLSTKLSRALARVRKAYPDFEL